MDRKFELGVITDEVSQDIFAAAAFCQKHGLTCMEVRSVNGHSPLQYTDEDVAQILEAATQYKLSVCAISSPVFKCEYDDSAAIEAHILGFEKCAGLANKLGAKYVRCFDFWDRQIPLADRAAMFDKLLPLCEKYDVYCLVESDPAVHSNTPHKLAQLLKAINHPRVLGLFDPGNEIWVTGQTSPDAYDTLKPCGIAHMHVKDAILCNGKATAVKIGTGLADFAGIFRKLLKDGYSGHVMLETHYRKKADLTEEQLKQPGGADFSDSALEASEESILALQEIIRIASEESV